MHTSRTCPRTPAASLACGAALASVAAAGAEWTSPVPVAKGGQIDVVADAEGRIHLIAGEYVQLDREGRTVTREGVGDGRQGALDFSPAIAVGPDGAVHIVTRHGGSWNSGHEIRYRRRNPEGKWDLDLAIGQPAARNYTVGAAAASDGRVYLTHSVHPPQEDMNSYLELYEIKDGKAVHLGRIRGRYMRADDGQRMRASGRFVHIAAGNPWPGGAVSYFAFIPAFGLPKKRKTHTSSGGRRGAPWICADGRGFVHLTYGSTMGTWYNKYTQDGRRLAKRDVKLSEGLGKWHLGTALSVVAAPDDGVKVVAVMIRSDGTKDIRNGALVWSWSGNGGAHWQELKETGFHTHGGEGRRRPGLVAVGQRFFLFFFSDRGIKMSTLDLSGETAPPQTRGRR